MPATGVVKDYLPDRGFGFIKPDAGGKDVFVHAVTLKQAGLELLSKGDRVSFEIDQDPRDRDGNPIGKGPRAINLALVN